MTIELLPCPHCGSPASIHTMPNDGNCNDGGQFVMCDNSRCMAASALVFPLMDSAEPLLAERWNRRVAASTAGAIQPHLDHQVGAPVTPLPIDSAGGAPTCSCESWSGRDNCAVHGDTGAPS